VVLGGTHQKNDFNLKVCPKDKEFIQSGCEKILPAIKSSQYLFDFVGLRPGRTEVRMETEKVKTKTGKSLPVVHCVGHGGCGVTLCWGCGEEVLENVTEIMKSLNYKSKL
jgi:D-amino-acid oxidase